MNNTNRLMHLDWLRFLVVASLIPFHAALTYTGNGDAYIYHPQIADYYMGLVENPSFTLTGLNKLTDFLSSFFMHLLFLIAGMSACFGLNRRTAAEFLKERLQKLLLPTILSILLFIPILSYFRNISLFQYSGSFFEFYPLFFNGIRGSFPEANFEWAHLWFMVYLFVFSIISLPFLKGIQKARWNPGKSSARLIITGIPFLMLIMEILFRPGWPGFQNLYNDWANFTNYLLYFITGFILIRYPDIRKKIQKPYPVYLVCGIILFIIKGNISSSAGFEWGYNRSTEFFVIVQTLCALSLTLGITGLGEAKLNKESRVLKSLRMFSFPLYILHYLPLTILAFMFLKTDLPVYMQWFLITIISYPSVFVLFSVLRRIPFVRLSIGISGKRKKILIMDFRET